MINANKFTEYEGILPLTLYNPLNSSIKQGTYTGINEEFYWSEVRSTASTYYNTFNLIQGELSWSNLLRITFSKEIFINLIRNNGVFLKINFTNLEHTNLSGINFFLEHSYDKSSGDVGYSQSSAINLLSDTESNYTACAYLPPSAFDNFFKEYNYVATKNVGVFIRFFGEDFTVSGNYSKLMLLIPNVNLEHYFPYFANLSSKDKAKIIEKTVPYFYGYKTLGDAINLATPQFFSVTNLTELGNYAYRREENQVGVAYSRIGWGGISGYNYVRLNVLSNNLGLSFSCDSLDGTTHFEAGQTGQMECVRFGKSYFSHTDHLNEYGNYLYCTDTTTIQNKNAPAGEFSIDYDSYMRVNLSDSGWDFLFKISGFTDEEIYEWCKSFPSKENFPYTPHFNALELGKVGAEKTAEDTVYTPYSAGMARVKLTNSADKPWSNNNSHYSFNPTWSDSNRSYDNGILKLTNVIGYSNLVDIINRIYTIPEFESIQNAGSFIAKLKISNLEITTTKESVILQLFFSRRYKKTDGNIGYWQINKSISHVANGSFILYYGKPELRKSMPSDFIEWEDDFVTFFIRLNVNSGDTVSLELEDLMLIQPSVCLDEAFPYFAGLSNSEKKEILDTLPFFEDEFVLGNTLVNKCNPDKGISKSMYYNTNTDTVTYDSGTNTIRIDYTDEISPETKGYIRIGQKADAKPEEDNNSLWYNRAELNFTEGPNTTDTTYYIRPFGTENYSMIVGDNVFNKFPVKSLSNGFIKKSFLTKTRNVNGTPIVAYMGGTPNYCSSEEFEGSIFQLKNVSCINLTKYGWHTLFKLVGASNQFIYEWSETLPYFKDTYTPRITSFLGYNSFRPEGEVYSDELIESEGAEAFGLVQPEYNLPDNVGLRMLPQGKMVSNQFVETETATGIQIVREPIEEIPDIDFVNMVPDFTSEEGGGGEAR